MHIPRCLALFGIVICNASVWVCASGGRPEFRGLVAWIGWASFSRVLNGEQRHPCCQFASKAVAGNICGDGAVDLQRTGKAFSCCPKAGSILSYKITQHESLCSCSEKQDCDALAKGTAKGVHLFDCMDGETQIPTALVNDDFCDCPSGVDEPGTPACSGVGVSTFLCRNEDFHEKVIPSSNVRDGICDCCDGSDEPHCPDECKQLAEEEAKVIEENSRVYLAGAKKRREAIKQAEGTFKRWRFGVKALKKVKTRLEAFAEKLKYCVQAEDQTKKAFDKEQLLKWARRKSRQLRLGTLEGDEVTPAASTLENENSSTTTAETEPDLGNHFHEANTTLDFENVDRFSKQIDDFLAIKVPMGQGGNSFPVPFSQYVELKIEDAKYRKRPLISQSINEQRKKAFLGPFFAQGPQAWVVLGKLIVEGLGVLIFPIRLLWELVLYVNSLTGISFSVPRFLHQPIMAYTRTIRISLMQSGITSLWFLFWDASPTLYFYLFGTPEADVLNKLPRHLNFLRQGESKVNDMLHQVDSGISSLERRLKMDYGPSREYLILVDECFEKEVHGYMWKLCHYKEAQQGTTSIGTFSAW
eukprot:CAMPEP_0203762598 /NCGR_PEP_ID=MMETSP0098-20131031/15444_1 /ASSEMBLY_ACC=CAM_ASM_000208 /TAXON_ID=96639 /ORGANISM=" , Strain NY0313808BC1" /LENGTH=584 /DNA_ID=CAMNT_0050657065 /DNA_START=1750 /DNA_END=3501 /DNA_ORIENTATION=+